MKTTIAAVFMSFALFACGGSGSSSSEQASTENTVTEEALVDSISTKVDVIKSEISSETEETIQEIDSLLNGI